jgi:hypothetical protein
MTADNSSLTSRIEKVNEGGVDTPEQLPDGTAFIGLKSLKYGGIYISVNKNVKRCKNFPYSVKFAIAVGNGKLHFVYITQDELPTVIRELLRRYLVPKK